MSLDGLRGLAAAVVLYHHLMVESLGRWSPPRWLVWPVEASAAVLIFFILSGYVIGLTNTGPASESAVRGYVWRRMVRLIPINTLAVLLACAAATDWDIPIAVTHLCFLENYVHYAGTWVPVIPTNGNLWSLNHEVVYYALFIAIWCIRPRFAVMAVVAVTVLLTGWFTPCLPVFLACYAAGSLFWIAGLALAWTGRKAETDRGPWPSAVLLALITWKLHVITRLMMPFPKPSVGGTTVRLYDLDFLPVALWLVAMVAGRTFRFMPLCRIMAIVIPGIGLFVRASLPAIGPAPSLAAVGVAYGIALLLLRWRPTMAWFRWVAPLGSISFALYAFARPIQRFVFTHSPWLPENGIGFGAAAAAVVAISVALAYFIECRIQPELQRRWVKRRVRATEPGAEALAGAEALGVGQGFRAEEQNAVRAAP